MQAWASVLLMRRTRRGASVGIGCCADSAKPAPAPARSGAAETCHSDALGQHGILSTTDSRSVHKVKHSEQHVQTLNIEFNLNSGLTCMVSAQARCSNLGTS